MNPQCGFRADPDRDRSREPTGENEPQSRHAACVIIDQDRGGVDAASIANQLPFTCSRFGGHARLRVLRSLMAQALYLRGGACAAKGRSGEAVAFCSGGLKAAT